MSPVYGAVAAVPGYWLRSTSSGIPSRSAWRCNRDGAMYVHVARQRCVPSLSRTPARSSSSRDTSVRPDDEPARRLHARGHVVAPRPPPRLSPSGSVASPVRRYRSSRRAVVRDGRAIASTHRSVGVDGMGQHLQVVDGVMSQRLERCRVGVAAARDAGRSTVVRRCTTARESRVSVPMPTGSLLCAITCTSRVPR